MDEPLVLSQVGSRLLVGTLVSLLGGFLFSGAVVAVIREDAKEFWKGRMLGTAERLFFTLAVVVTPTAVVVPAMLTWIGGKMAAGWNQEKDAEKKARMAALGGGIASMFFALVGGLIAAGRIK